MKWTRPLELFVELMVALWCIDIVSKPFKGKEGNGLSSYSVKCHELNPSCSMTPQTSDLALSTVEG